MALQDDVKNLAQELPKLVLTNDWVSLSRLLMSLTATLEGQGTSPWLGSLAYVFPAQPTANNPGDFYFNTIQNIVWCWDGAAWQQFGPFP